MTAEERRHEIIRQLDTAGRVENTILAESLNVSLDTIRRDLRILSTAGIIRRTHGGATRVDYLELALKVNKEPNLVAKRNIAYKALDYIRPGETVGMDIGSTSVQFARALTNSNRRRFIKVFTADLRVCRILATAKNIEINIPGGNVGRRDYLIGPITEEFLANTTFDTVFLSASGITFAGGISEPSRYIAEVKKAMISNAKRIILLTDQSKFGRLFKNHVTKLEQINMVITDRACPPDVLAECEKRGIVCVLA